MSNAIQELLLRISGDSKGGQVAVQEMVSSLKGAETTIVTANERIAASSTMFGQAMAQSSATAAASLETVATTATATATAVEAESGKALAATDALLAKIEAREAAEAAAAATTGKATVATESLGATLLNAVSKYAVYAVAAQMATEALVDLYTWQQKNRLESETAAAKQDTINRAFEVSHGITMSYGDAVKYLNEQLGHFNPLAADAEKNQVTLTLAMAKGPAAAYAETLRQLALAQQDVRQAYQADLAKTGGLDGMTAGLELLRRGTVESDAAFGDWARRLNLSATTIALLRDQVEAENAAQKELTETTKRHNEEIEKQREAERKRAEQRRDAALKADADLAGHLLGGDDLERGKQMLRVYGQVSDITAMTTDRQQELNSALARALDTYVALGATAPLEMTRVWAATARIPLPRGAVGIENIGTSIPMELPPDAYGRSVPHFPTLVSNPAIRPGLGSALADGLNEQLRALPQLLQMSLTGGGGWSGFGQAAGVGGLSMLGSTLAKQFGPSGTGLGSALASGGLSIAFGAGITGAIALASKLHQSESEKLGKDIGRDIGVEIAPEMLKAWEKDAKKFGRQATTILHLDDLITAAGGLNDDNLDMFTGKLRDTFSMIETHQLSIAQGTEILDRNWATFAEAGTDAAGRISAGLREIIGLDERIGTQSQAIAAWRKQQGANALAGFTTSIQDGSSLTDAATLSAAGTRALGSYAAAIASGTSPAEALAQLALVLETIKAAYDRLGLSIEDAGLQQLMLLSTIQQKAGPALGAIAGITQEMIALDNLGLETKEMFQAQQVSVAAYYRQVQAAVAASADAKMSDRDKTKLALSQMQDFLHQAQEEAERLGIPLDENTQILIDQSKELGVWKDKGKSATDVLVDGMTTLVGTVRELINQLRGIPPEVNTNINVNTRYTEENGGAGSGTEDPPVAHTGAMVLTGGLQRFHRGRVSGLGGDELLAVLQAGEAVIQAPAVRSLGWQTMRAVNSGDAGAVVRSMLSRIPRLDPNGGDDRGAAAGVWNPPSGSSAMTVHFGDTHIHAPGVFLRDMEAFVPLFKDAIRRNVGDIRTTLEAVRRPGQAA